MFPNGSPENEGLAAEQLDVASNGLASVYSTASGLCDWIAESDSGSITAKVYVRSGSPVLDHKGEISGKPDMYGSANTLKGLTVLGPTSTMEQWIGKLVLCTVWPDCRFGLRISEHGSRSSRTGDSDR